MSLMAISTSTYTIDIKNKSIVQIGECLHYNPCFSAVTTTPRVLTVTDDPVNATHSPDSLMGFKWIFVLSLLLLQAAYYRRLNGSVFKSRKMALTGVS
ncbi:hypothetical protein B296_00008325 [Ensete ventricosum]|uniref:Uncharacterized protein n=1 Tax=Ensete ventricosum TaxID=4639 RepID=A0A426ZUA6_ENSVE|nr:hypothetical protein B296_00008325 [Ensete ventricosum]